MLKSLDQKLARLAADPTADEFILADAKDADMAFGLAAPGKSPEHYAHEARFRSIADYRERIRRNVAQGLLDIMLMSASTSELLTIGERLFDASHVTPAVRANDTSEIWLAGGGGQYAAQPSRPFRSATIDHTMCGKAACEPHERALGADLGLYSVTFNNDVQRDRETLEHYERFRLEAEAKGFRHFLEVFDPNAPLAPIADVPRFMNDHIARTLAGITQRGRPLFLKIPYHGPEQMEQLASFDPRLIPGILGGSAGTTFDGYHQLWEAKKHGAKVALYGRKINNAEHQPTFIHYLRAVADGQIDPDEAVRAYHGELATLGIRPHRPLEDDLKRTATASGYAGQSSSRTVATTTTPIPTPETTTTASSNARPDFAHMSRAEKVEWNRRRWSNIIG